MEMDYPVLIIGAGPSGATTALLLATYGIKCLAISRHMGTANTPRAHIFNQRAMEVLRHAGLEPQLSKLASPAIEMQHTSWLNTLAGEEYGRIFAWGNKPSEKGRYEPASPCEMSDLPQSVLEPVLVEEARRRGAEIRFATEFVKLQETTGGIKATLRDRKTGEEYEVRSQYLVGADGARSKVIDALGIPVVGKQINTAFNVHIKADLGKYIAHRPGSLNWVLNPDAPGWSAVGNFRMVRPWDEFVVSMHPATKDGATFQPSKEAILERLKQMIGDDTIPIEILSTFSWTINDQVAERWHEGRAFCIGDATHRHPPINGLGSNTCISDAFNLAWKLAYVIHGWAARSLLDTLTTERKPVGEAIVRRANEGMEVQRRIWSLLGLDPESRRKSVSLMKSPTSEGQCARKNLREALEGADLEVQALGIQMNQIYRDSTAILVEPKDQPPNFDRLDPLKEVMISTFPGYHLPHVWLAAHSQSKRVSILDICGPAEFTLLTGIGGNEWLTACSNINKANGPKIQGYSIGFGCDYMDCYSEWFRVRGVEETGAVLVRPDQFVAWRCNEVPEDPLALLKSVLERLLWC